MKPFTLGIATGMSSLALAVPLLATGVAAQSASSAGNATARATPTQECVRAMADLERAHLDSFDMMNEQRKKTMQAHLDELEDIAHITDATQRAEAMRAMHLAMHDARQAAKDTMPAAVTTAMEAVRSTCGDVMGMHNHGMMGMHKNRRGMNVRMAPPGQANAAILQ